MSGRWRDGLRRAGWALIGVTVLTAVLWVFLRALGDQTDTEFNRSVGWANILGLTGGLGTVLVVLDNSGSESLLANGYADC